MKKNSPFIYIGILVVGVFAGWLIFGNDSNETKEQDHQLDQAQEEQQQMWTCSMHPQIMQPEPGDCPICGMELIPAEAGADGLTVDQFRLTDNAMALANIQTTIIGERTTENPTITLSGKIEENEITKAVQVSFFSGRIEGLNIGFTGQKVSKGQRLATIYSPELYVAQQELITLSSLKETQPALYKGARNKLKLWKLSEAQINQIEASGKIVENFPVYATISGTVTEKLVEKGEYIKQGQALFKIANLNTVWANFDIYESQIGLFRKGQQVKITTNAYPNREFNGTVDFINPVLNTQTRTVKLRVVLDNKSDIFKPGMFVSANIKASQNGSNEKISIPASAVLWTGERSVVYLKTNPDSPIFEMKEISLGNKIGDNYEVLDGLFLGNEIVTNGTFTVDAAAQLQGKKSMMNKSGGVSTTGHENHAGTGDIHTSSNNYSQSIRLEVSKEFQNQLKQVVKNYIELKNALVQENSNESKEKAKSLFSYLNKINSKLLKGDALTSWKTMEKEIDSATKELSNSSDIKTQREHFKHLSSHLIQAVQKFGINEKIYVDFCPMAGDNKGAFWLSKEKKISNPYYGESMLTCGEISEVIE